MKNAFSTLIIALCATVVGLALPTVGAAQTVDPKLEWATKVVALQQGPELNRLLEQLANSTAQDLLQKWGPKLQANVPKSKLPQVTEELNAELQKYSKEVAQLIGGKVGKVSTDALVPAYMEKFTVAELQQVAAFFESPVIKKYQAAAPELGNTFIQQLIEAARADVSTRASQFDDVAAKIIGAGTAPKASPTSPSNSKPAAKK